MSNDNIISLFVNSVADCCYLIGKMTHSLFLNNSFNKREKDLDYFFQSVALKNKLDQYPTILNDNGAYIVKVPAGLNLNNFIKVQDSLETYLEYSVKMSIDNQVLKITKADNKQLENNIPYSQYKRTTSHIEFSIGKSIDSILKLDLKENPHSYIVGTTGSGKSVMTKVILSNLVSLYGANELELYLCDLKRVELNLFRNVRQCKKFVYTVSDTTEVIADLLEETNKRYDLFMEHEVTNIFEYNKLPNVKKLKYQVLYVEEIVMLLEDKKKQAMKLLKQLIAISRASGCYVFLTTQRPSNDVIDNVVKANINNRIVLKCEDSKNSIVALDKEGAEDLRGNGHGILKRGSELVEFQGYYISDDEVKKIIKPFIKTKDFQFKEIKAIKRENKNIKIDNDKLLKGDNKTSKNKPSEVTEVKEDNKIIDLSFIDNL